MRTIEKILWYTPYTPEQIWLLRVIGLYNGTGSDWIFFDRIIDAIFDTLEEAKIFNHKKKTQLRRDIEQLVIRHDCDFHFRIGFGLANRRLAYWLYQLLYKFPWRYRVGIAFIVYRAVSSKKAKEVYNS